MKVLVKGNSGHLGEALMRELRAQLGLAKTKLARFNADLTADQYD